MTSPQHLKPEYYLGITNTIAHFMVSWDTLLSDIICTKSAEEMSKFCTRLFGGDSLQSKHLHQNMTTGSFFFKTRGRGEKGRGGRRQKGRKEEGQEEKEVKEKK